MTTVNGLPAHILLVHAIVVLLPLSALVLVLTACLPSVRRRLAGANAILSVLVVILVPITTNAGEWLERRVARTPLVRAHTEIGDTAIWAAIPVAVLALALWWRQREAGAAAADAGAAGSDADAAAAGGSVAAVTGAGAHAGAALAGGPAVPDGVGAATGGGAAAAALNAGASAAAGGAAAGVGVPGSGGAAEGAPGATSARAGVGVPGSVGAGADAAVAGGAVAGGAGSEVPEAAAAGTAAAGARQAGLAVSGASASKAAANRRRVFLAPASKAVSVTLIVLSILAGGAAVYDIVRIGDTGAQASWQGQFQQNPAPRGR